MLKFSMRYAYNDMLNLCFYPFHRITKFLEKPSPSETSSRLASVVFYCLRRTSLTLVTDYLNDRPDVQQRTFGEFMVSIKIRSPTSAETDDFYCLWPRASRGFQAVKVINFCTEGKF